MSFSTTCPKCGAEDQLSVVYYEANGSIPLFEDGFSESDARYLDTENEIVECGACEKRFSLTEVIPNE